MKSISVLQPSSSPGLRVFSNPNQELADQINTALGRPKGGMRSKRFADGEIYVQLSESVRGKDVFVLQSTCVPVNESLIEMSLMLGACHSASAERITAVIPYYRYARADRRTSRDSVGAKLMADLITTSGADRLLVVDLHSAQTEGFFNIPVDHITAIPVLGDYFRSKNLDSLVVVSPDAGGVARTRSFAKKLGENIPLAFIDKRRPEHNVVEVMNVIGDVEDKTTILVDDIIDTAGTIVKASQALLDHGAKEVYVCATHAVFSERAAMLLENSSIKEIIVTNTVAIPPEKRLSKLTVLSVADLLSEAIFRIHTNRSISELFD
jgi:ribose-phosphate pyrophosphokinase